MRCLLPLLIASTASADPSIRIVEDAALGAELSADRPLLGDGKGMAAALDACAATPTPHTGSAVLWLEISRAGTVSTVHVHGAGKLDACLERAIAKGAVAHKLGNAVIMVGHLDVIESESSKYLPSPRSSPAPVILDAHHTKWQLTANRIMYTANRMLDITQALDGVSSAISDCAGKRGERATAAPMLVWMDGHAIVRSGITAYDDCIAKALGPLKLPAPESAFWMQIDITAPTETFAPRTDKAALSHPQAIRDALTTAVRSRKLELQGCLDGHPKTTLVKLEVTLYGTRANVKMVSTGNDDADACVRKTFHDVSIPSSIASDKVDLEVTLEAD